MTLFLISFIRSPFSFKTITVLRTSLDNGGMTADSPSPRPLLQQNACMRRFCPAPAHENRPAGTGVGTCTVEEKPAVAGMGSCGNPRVTRSGTTAKGLLARELYYNSFIPYNARHPEEEWRKMNKMCGLQTAEHWFPKLIGCSKRGSPCIARLDSLFHVNHYLVDAILKLGRRDSWFWQTCKFARINLHAQTPPPTELQVHITLWNFDA